MKKIILLILLILIGCENEQQEERLQLSPNLHSLLKKAESKAPVSKEYYSLSDSAYQIALKENSQSGKAAALSNIGKYFYEKDDLKKAEKTLHKAIELLADTLHKNQKGEIYHRLGDIYYRSGRENKTIEAYKKAINFRKEGRDSVGLGASLNDLGYTYWHTAKYDSAIIYYRKALNVRKELSNKKAYALTLNNIGTVYYQWSIYDKALEYFTKSLKIRKKLNDKPGVALVCSNIGQSFREIDSLNKAEQYFDKSLQFAKESKDTQAIAYALVSKASIHEEEDSAAAADLYKKSIRFYRKSGYLEGLLSGLQHITQFYLDRNEFDRAKEYLDEMYLQAEKRNVDLSIAESNKIYGNFYKKQGSLNKAITYYETAIAQSEKIKNNEFLRDSYKALSGIYNSRGNYKKAFTYYLNYLDYKDALENEDMERRISQLQNKFEVEKYQRKIDAQKFTNEKQKIVIFYIAGGILVLLGVAFGLFLIARKRKALNKLLAEKNKQIELQHEELSQKNKDLVELNKTKDQFFSIVAHDLKNPFVTLLGYSNILREDFKELTKDEKLEYIYEIKNTTKKTNALLENLLDWSASQTGKIEYTPANMNLREMVESVSGLLESQAKNKNIRILNNVEDTARAYADWHMIEVVLRNLLTNAIKFSKETTSVEIDAESRDEEMVISVQDFGMGMDENSRKNLFDINNNSSQKGTKSEKGIGLGLTISKEFVEKNEGSIWVESKINEGSVFYISLPHAASKN